MGKELDCLEEPGIVIKENYSDWATPIVPIPKQDGSIRVCGDFKVTINPFLNVDQYPLPKPSDLMTCLTGGKMFTKLDLTAAYQQILLEQVGCNKHTPGLIQIYTVAVWGRFGTSGIPKGHGLNPTGNVPCNLLY